MNPTRAALVLQHSPPGETRANLDTCLELATQAADLGADLVLFPELNITGYCTNSEIASFAAPLPGPITDALLDTATRLNITILAGMLEKEGANTLFATHVAAMKNGSLGRYRKLHLAPPEKEIFTQGTTIETFTTNDFNFGIQMCYDAHFPELSTRMALGGADILLIPHASPRKTPKEKLDSWMRHLGARAFDNGLFVLACNQVGTHPSGLAFPGVAVAIGPDGKIIKSLLGDHGDLLILDLDSELLERVRSHRMRYFLPNRRNDLY
ncbi:MAG: nitrilase [Desulfobacterium sp.]|nr:nitrilase [Desulfobacterium sp.]